MENPELLPISFRISQVLGMALVLAALVAWVSAIRAGNPQEDKMLRLLEESELVSTSFWMQMVEKHGDTMKNCHI